MKLLENKKIFIVEDDALNRLVFRLMLNKEGAKTEFENGGAFVLARLQQVAPVDLIILDLMLARGNDGYDVFDAIRAIPLYSQIPIVAVSAADPTQSVLRARTKGFNGFIPKPINAEIFPQQMLDILNGKTIWQSDYAG
jgi:CheY-like chemotaxis protein